MKNLLYYFLIIGLTASIFVSGCSKSVEDRQNQLWVNSFPEGASVYMLPGSVSDYYSKELTDEQYLQGSTPIYVDIKSTSCVITVSIPADKIEEMGYSIEYPHLSNGPNADDCFELDGNLYAEFGSDPEIQGRLSHVVKAYDVRDKEASIISILVPFDKEDYPKSRPYIYPSLDMVSSFGSNYPVDESTLADKIKENLIENKFESVVGAAMITDMAAVVSRVGKVVLFYSDHIHVVVQVLDPDSGAYWIKTQYW